MKKFMLPVLALMLSLLFAFGFTACSESIDYTTATYSELKEVDWDSDKKVVKYQFLNDTIEGYGAYWPVCLNLYEDGSAAAWQATVTGFHVTHWADEEHLILWDFYGSWSEEGSTITLNLKGEAATLTTDFGDRVTPDALSYTITVSGGKATIIDFVLMSSTGHNLKGLVTCDGTVHYEGFTEFYNSYKDSYSEEG